MNCRIFRSDKKEETYLFLTRDQSFVELPDELRATFGDPVFVMALKLSSDSKLARVDARTVVESLQKHGYFLQLPPKFPVEEEISKHFS